MYEQIARNKRNSVVLCVLFVAFVAFLAQALPIYFVGMVGSG